MLKDFHLLRVWPLLRRVLGGLGLGLSVSALPAVAYAGPPVPDHWLRYAQFVSVAFQQRLGDPDNAAVLRLHAWLQERRLQPPALVVRLWVAPAGQIERLEFDSLGQSQADADLRGLLTSGPLSAPPPRDMRQPMVLQLSLDFPS